ncbi:hypothetical protein L1049_001610 [Liquidambar formosana]|uniref:1,3-beta-glucan synthase component FKS1-like domain-containing protein n=1 Tax=Liquidambar formosana TaxID=63359 RepID=A0AAP0N934_LIQFO
MASSSGTKDGQGPPRSLSRKMTRMPTMVADASVDDNSLVDSELVPSSIAPIAPILRVANEIEEENPRVAYLCRFHALEKAHKMDPTSSGRGVRQFKTYLLHRLEREEEEIERKLAKSDPREIQRFYRNFYEKNIKEGQHTKKPEEMAKIYQIATVLYNVLRAMEPFTKIDDEIQMIAKEVQMKREQYKHYNIIPLHAAGVKPAIVEFPEIKDAIHALRNVNNLPLPRIQSTLDVPHDDPLMGDDEDKSVNDILDWLSSLFGFQKGNVANQREHLILLLANINLGNSGPLLQMYGGGGGTVGQLMDKIFKNYRTWCHYLHRRSNLIFTGSDDRQQLELLYIGLYLLIWGEASNIRFMPECICYIFHQMANNLYGVLFSNAHPVSGGTYEAAQYGEESFLKTVITPIYEVLRKTMRHTGYRAWDEEP